MSQFARAHPDDWQERLEQMRDIDPRCPECNGPHPSHAPGCQEDPAFWRHVNDEIDRRREESWR
jgi:hypothetical protein